jgi:hypothetical protein
MISHVEEWRSQMNLKCNIYVPEHRTERFSSIEVIANFWEQLEVDKIGVFFDKNS